MAAKKPKTQKTTFVDVNIQKQMQDAKKESK